MPEGVTLVAVSKTRPLEQLSEAYDSGQRHFGENRPQEMKSKWQELPKDIHWHMIGHLQTNKVKYIIDFVHLIHSVDSLRLLEEIDKRALRAERRVDVLLQVHIAQEEEKFGFGAEEVRAFFTGRAYSAYPNVRIVGLMGMATNTADGEVVRAEFDALRSLFDSLKPLADGASLQMETLSMGMSGDYELAIDCGSTMVRVGSRIFGARN